VTPRQDIPGFAAGAFSFEAEEAQLFLADMAGTGVYSPDVQVTGPGGTVARVDDENDLFFYGAAGAYTVFCLNDGASDDSDVSLTLRLKTPLALGTLAAGDTITAEGPALADGFGGFEEAWGLAELSPELLTRFELSADAGDPRFYIYRPDGTLLRAARRAHVTDGIHVDLREGGAVLVRVDAYDRALVDWTLRASAAARPVFGDAEPNDSRALASALGALPATVLGRMEPDGKDVWRVDLEQPLQPGQSLRVRFDNLEGDAVTSQLSDGVELRLLDASYAALPALPADGLLAATLTAHEAAVGDGPIYVELFGDFIYDAAGYVLSVDVVDVGVEVEPNDDALSADAIGPLPAELVGYRSADGGDDFFRVELPTALAADESLRVRAWNTSTNNPISLEVLDGAGAVLGASSRVLPDVLVGGLAAGEVFVRLSGATGGEPGYRLRAEIAGRTEAEPNDSTTLAGDLGTLGTAGSVGTDLTASAGDEDYFELSTSAPVPAGAGLLVTLDNLDDGSDHLVELWDVSVSDAPVLLGVDEAATARVLAGAAGSGGPFRIRVAGAGSSDDHLRLSVRLIDDADHIEQEANDTPAQAEVLALPFRVRGMASAGDTDTFSVTVPAGTPLSTDVAVHLENESDGTSIQLQVYSASGNLVYDGAGFRVRWSAPAVPGTWRVEVTSTSASVDAADLYFLDVELR
jgi:hypothetical protein